MSVSWLKSQVKSKVESHLRHGDDAGVQQTFSAPDAVIAANQYSTEGIRLSRALWDHFWNAQFNHFTIAKASSETVHSGEGYEGYTLWPFVCFPVPR